MKSNFALSLSFDGLRLMHRVADGWHLVGQVALDDPDLNDALTRLRAAADALEPAGIATKLLIPNDQIKYLALDTTRAEEAEVRAALDGATPYPVQDLAYDYSKGGGRTYVAAVARETLTEAEQFATEYGFNPISFAAVPEPFTYVGEAFFGATAGNSAERDVEPVNVTGTVAGYAVTKAPEIAKPAAKPPESGPASEPVSDPAPSAGAAGEPEATEKPATKATAPQLTEENAETTDQKATSSKADDLAAPDVPAGAEKSAALVNPDDTHDPAPDSSATDTVDPVEGEPPNSPSNPAADADATPDAKADNPPLFSSRLRADRAQGRPSPAPDLAAPKDSATAAASPAAAIGRAEPTFGAARAPSLAVPTGKGTDAMPPVAAPARDGPAVATSIPAPSVSARTPAEAAAPAITGDAPSALPADIAAAAAASLEVEPATRTPPPTLVRAKAQGAEGHDAAAPTQRGGRGSGGTANAMFASRRMVPEDANATTGTKSDAGTTSASPDETPPETVFGARKPRKIRHVVGGKPRFLGLILTAILLLFLLAFAAFAALSDVGIAAWFGFGSDDTQIAAEQGPDPAMVAAPEVAAVQTGDDDPSAMAPDTLAVPITPPIAADDAQVLSPEEADRIYAATGVWQRAPRIPLIPRTTTLENMALGESSQPVPRVPPSPLASASSVAGDALIATPIDPPAPDTTFDFGENGLIVATPQGAVTPDGTLVTLGRPPLNPPTRPGTVAPEVTPQDLLAEVTPDGAEPVADAPDGVILISGRPSVEPPVRPGTPAAAPVMLDSPSDTPGSADDQPDGSDEPEGLDVPEALDVIVGPPPVLPPTRPGTESSQEDAAAEGLSGDVALALGTAAAQTPTPDTVRPRQRPADVIAAAVQAVEDQATNPVVDNLSGQQTASLRPQNRPTGLAPAPTQPESEPEPEPVVAVVQVPAAPTGLQLSPEIAAAVLAAANRPDPIVNPTGQAVTISRRPDTRPRNMDRIVARAAQTQQRVATQVAAAVPQPAAVAPSGPTAGTVAQTATLGNAINLRDINLIGIFGGDSDRRALVRLSNGRYQRVTVGDNLDGGRVTAISAGALSYTKRGRAITLQVAG